MRRHGTDDGAVRKDNNVGIGSDDRLQDGLVAPQHVTQRFAAFHARIHIPGEPAAQGEGIGITRRIGSGHLVDTGEDFMEPRRRLDGQRIRIPAARFLEGARRRHRRLLRANRDG